MCLKNMMTECVWDSLGKPWQAAFTQGWEAFCHGCLPIGAVITDENDTILSVGRNRLFEPGGLNPRMAHAEMEALQKLDTAQFPDVYTYTLYTTMEPCPMCMGAFVMSNLRHLCVAARDGYAGSTHFCVSDPYIASKKIKLDFACGMAETVQLAMQTYFELQRSRGAMNKVVEVFKRDNPSAVEAAKILYEAHYLEKAAAVHTEMGEVFAYIANLSALT